MLQRPTEDSWKMARYSWNNFGITANMSRCPRLESRLIWAFSSRCCGEGMALIDRKSNAVIENLTDYKVVGLENLGLKDEGDPYAYKIQKLGQKYLLLQLEPLSRPEGYEVLSVREVTGLFAETLRYKFQGITANTPNVQITGREGTAVLDSINETAAVTFTNLKTRYDGYSHTDVVRNIIPVA